MQMNLSIINSFITRRFVCFPFPYQLICIVRGEEGGDDGGNNANVLNVHDSPYIN